MIEETFPTAAEAIALTADNRFKAILRHVSDQMHEGQGYSALEIFHDIGLTNDMQARLEAKLGPLGYRVELEGAKMLRVSWYPKQEENKHE